ncbi:MAG: hypothetical protein AAGJ31_13785, partial [Verrucomicrobiota bacterium]
METASSSSLVFHASPFSLVFGGLIIAVGLGFCFWAWRRSGFRPQVGALEGLRALILIFVAILLNQPEWRTLQTPDAKPVVSVLWDESKSMETMDVFETGEAGEQRAIPRSA